MTTWAIKQIYNISRPGEPSASGDLVEIECVGGWVQEVDPVTRQCRDVHQRFQVVGLNGDLKPVPKLTSITFSWAKARNRAK